MRREAMLWWASTILLTLAVVVVCAFADAGEQAIAFAILMHLEFKMMKYDLNHEKP